MSVISMPRTLAVATDSAPGAIGSDRFPGVESVRPAPEAPVPRGKHVVELDEQSIERAGEQRHAVLDVEPGLLVPGAEVRAGVLPGAGDRFGGGELVPHRHAFLVAGHQT